MRSRRRINRSMIRSISKEHEEHQEHEEHHHAPSASTIITSAADKQIRISQSADHTDQQKISRSAAEASLALAYKSSVIISSRSASSGSECTWHWNIHINIILSQHPHQQITISFSLKNISISRHEIIIRTYQEYHLHQYSFFSTMPTPLVHPSSRSTSSTAAAALHLPHHPSYHGNHHQNPSFVSSMLLLLIINILLLLLILSLRDSSASWSNLLCFPPAHHPNAATWPIVWDNRKCREGQYMNLKPAGL
jgi:hypothetical protein